MVSKSNITAAEFSQLQIGLRTRWADLIVQLQAGKIDDVFTVRLRKDDNTSAERARARHSIYAIALHHGIRVKLSSSDAGILVMHGGEVVLARAAGAGSMQ